MKDLLQLIIENLVDNKQAIVITEEENEKMITYKVKVDKTDMGKVIGKEGRLAKSIRTIIKAVATKGTKRVMVEFVE